MALQARNRRPLSDRIHGLLPSGHSHRVFIRPLLTSISSVSGLRRSVCHGIRHIPGANKVVDTLSRTVVVEPRLLLTSPPSLGHSSKTHLCRNCSPRIPHYACAASQSWTDSHFSATSPPALLVRICRARSTNHSQEAGTTWHTGAWNLTSGVRVLRHQHPRRHWIYTSPASAGLHPVNPAYGSTVQLPVRYCQVTFLCDLSREVVISKVGASSYLVYSSS